MKNRIEDLIKSKMNVSKISLADFTEKHEGHQNYEGGGHFEPVIISDDFENLSLLDRHKKIYEILGDLMKNEIHAFSMKTYTNKEFKALK